ncbi:hypothetical protein ACJX0J_031781, partial [Zea mays]
YFWLVHATTAHVVHVQPPFFWLVHIIIVHVAMTIYFNNRTMYSFTNPYSTIYAPVNIISHNIQHNNNVTCYIEMREEAISLQGHVQYTIERK